MGVVKECSGKGHCRTILGETPKKKEIVRVEKELSP
jgi:hypothetical protein